MIRRTYFVFGTCRSRPLTLAHTYTHTNVRACVRTVQYGRRLTAIFAELKVRRFAAVCLQLPSTAYSVCVFARFRPLSYDSVEFASQRRRYTCYGSAIRVQRACVYTSTCLQIHTTLRSTSDQVRLPAEFKHINRRRKRN